MRKWISILLFLGLLIFSLPAWEGSGRDLSLWENFIHFAMKFFPPDFSDSQELLAGLKETLQVGILATSLAAGISLVIALLGGPWMPQWSRAGVAFFLAAVRSIPSLIWAVLAVAVVGANPRAGVLALTFYSIGYLGKFLLDDFLHIDQQLWRTYLRWGLHPFMAFRYGFWPQLKSRYVAHCIWMLEYNIRSASIIGYVGAGGLGLRLHAYQEFGQWSRFSAVLLVILAIVLVFEFGMRKWKKGEKS